MRGNSIKDGENVNSDSDCKHGVESIIESFELLSLFLNLFSCTIFLAFFSPGRKGLLVEFVVIT